MERCDAIFSVTRESLVFYARAKFAVGVEATGVRRYVPILHNSESTKSTVGSVHMVGREGRGATDEEQPVRWVRLLYSSTLPPMLEPLESVYK